MILLQRIGFGATALALGRIIQAIAEGAHWLILPAVLLAVAVVIGVFTIGTTPRRRP